MARLESPGGWQRVGIGACALAAAALALALSSAYGRTRRSWALPTAIAALAVSLAAGAASLAGYRAYGIMADTRAVVVWRSGILRSSPPRPTSPRRQRHSPRGPRQSRTSRSSEWVRLSFPNGQTGWVPGSEVIYLWRPPPR